MNGNNLSIVVASGNPHKVEEIRAVCAQCAGEKSSRTIPPSPLNVQWLSLQDLGGAFPEAVEDGDTFEANAVKKALHYAALTGRMVLADDSGLEVDALGGHPGVYSARYAGVSGARKVVDMENNKKLLRKLEGVPMDRRTARFVCTMALVQGREVMVTVRGTVEGRILLPTECANPNEPWRGRGSNGFGYDPLFFHDDSDCTTAELTAEAKNAISHRGRATRLLWAQLQRLFA